MSPKTPPNVPGPSNEGESLRSDATSATNAKTERTVAEPKKKRRGLQVALGLVLGVIAAFLLAWGGLVLLTEYFGRAENTTVFALLGAGIVAVIVAILAGRKFLPFAITFAVAAIIVLAVLYYFLAQFSFTTA